MTSANGADETEATVFTRLVGPRTQEDHIFGKYRTKTGSDRGTEKGTFVEGGILLQNRSAAHKGSSSRGGEISGFLGRAVGVRDRGALIGRRANGRKPIAIAIAIATIIAVVIDDSDAAITRASFVFEGCWNF